MFTVLSTSCFTAHAEEIKHEDLDVGELVGKVIKDVNASNAVLNHQPFSLSTDEVFSYLVCYAHFLFYSLGPLQPPT